MIGNPTTADLWDLFWRYEENARIGSAEYRLAAATMAEAIAKIIAARESR